MRLGAVEAVHARRAGAYARTRHDDGVQVHEFQGPIFNFGDDLISFSSIEGMTNFIEPCDVEDTDRAFDAQGRRIKLRGVGVKRTRFTVGGGETVFDSQESGELASTEFAELLRNDVRRLGPARFGLFEDEVDSLPLDRLVKVVHPLTSAGDKF